MAHILIYTDNADAAIKSLDTCMRLDPLYPDLALYFLAEARISLGQFDEAITALKQRLVPSLRFAAARLVGIDREIPAAARSRALGNRASFEPSIPAGCMRIRSIRFVRSEREPCT